ncbi:MAG: hypothetical protein BGO98_25570 [Myxococcales bacterium 68-20]|nr:hypothetical protein [Myxococcales bacterium]OJY16018.1 MAG: hypothetical protein BGO98_25570 [Myxococcales bacterium 68-20]
MSEYQCYEFAALERPLSAKELAELREISTRADISPTRFWNEYQWGDLKADPAKLLERYFDAHLYFANWGTRRLMLRLPRARFEPKMLAPYFPRSHAARLVTATGHLVLDLSSEEEDFDYVESPGSLSTLGQLRAELLRGDLRPAYLAWLLAVQNDEVDDASREPPVPEGLSQLTAAQDAMVEFLRIDIDLLGAAATGSKPEADDGPQLRQWVAELPAKETTAWLNRAVEQPDLALGNELLRAFRAMRQTKASLPIRSVAELRAQADALRAAREQAAVARARKAKAAAEAARQRHLSKLANDVDGAWTRLATLVAESRYDEALRVAIELRDLAARDGEDANFSTRFEAFRKIHMRRRGFFDRWKRAARST